MALVKICPVCGFANPANEMLCQQCITSLGDVIPVPETVEKTPEEVPGKNTAHTSSNEPTIRISGSLQFFGEDDQPAFCCGANDIIGREYNGADFLAEYPTVSRSHCSVRLTLHGWEIEDLNSTNGTWLNGRRIAKSERLENGDIISLSQRCKLKVKI